VLPIIFERLWDAPASRYGIEIANLGGVDNAAGGKEAPFSALWRLVDYLHNHQTLAFVLLDNEGMAARNVGTGLPKVNSVHSVDRKATRRDQIRLWRTSFKLENFSNTEIAKALNRIVGRKLFAHGDVAVCRAAVPAGQTMGQKLRMMGRLFEERTGGLLDKPRLGMILVDIMMNPKARRKPGNRPMTKFLMRVARKASLNFQPVTQEDWESNQRSGYLGTFQPAARQARRRRLDSRRRQRRRPSGG
jgi:hypothetical protein